MLANTVVVHIGISSRAIVKRRLLDKILVSYSKLRYAIENFINTLLHPKSYLQNTKLVF